MLRKQTKFQICLKHYKRLMWANRRRLAEIFLEGGPCDGHCEGSTCRLWPGTDLFDVSLCESERNLPWTKREGSAE